MDGQLTFISFWRANASRAMGRLGRALRPNLCQFLKKFFTISGRLIDSFCSLIDMPLAAEIRILKRVCPGLQLARTTLCSVLEQANLFVERSKGGDPFEEAKH